jgi:hypothetical protein
VSDCPVEQLHGVAQSRQRDNLASHSTTLPGPSGASATVYSDSRASLYKPQWLLLLLATRLQRLLLSLATRLLRLSLSIATHL